MIPDTEMLKIRVKAGKEYDIDLNEVLSMNESNLNKAYMEQSPLFAWWSSARAIAGKYAEQLRKKLNLRRSQLMKDLRKESDEKLAKWTLSDIEARILLDEEYSLLADKIIEAEYNFNLLNSVCTALEHRKEMLISLGAQIRSEHRQLG